MLKTIDTEELRQYVWLHADETTRKIKAGILKEHGVSKSLQWISKEKKAYEAEKVTIPIPEVSVEDPEISKLKTEIAKFQLKKQLEIKKKELLLEKADVEDIEDLVEDLKYFKNHNRLLTRKLVEELQRRDNWVNAACPKCKEKFLFSVAPNRAVCYVCGKWCTHD